MANTRSLYRMGHEMARVYCGSFKRTPKKMVLDIDETFDPKFSSWGKTVLWQVIDVEPITVFGMFKNG